MYNITEYPLHYGYLVYWLYDFKDGEPYVHKAGVKKVCLNEQMMALYKQYFAQLQQFIKKGKEDFDPRKVNVKKCAACSLNPYCMHKTKRYSTVHYPYRSIDLQLYRTEFPADLRWAPDHQI